MELLQVAGVPPGKIHRAADLTGWPYARQRRLFREERHPYGSGPFVQDNALIHAERVADPSAVPAPMLGERTYPIAKELLGLDGEEIDDLVRRGVLDARAS